MKIISKITLSLMVCLFGFVMHSGAQSCKALVEDLYNWAKTPGQYVSFKLVSLHKTKFWAQYTEGTLNAYDKPGVVHGLVVISPSRGLSGTAQQYFSDRFSSCPTAAKTSSGAPNFVVDYWFSKYKADQMGIDIQLTSGSSSCSEVTVDMVLKSWGNAKASYCASCYNGYMYLLDAGNVLIFNKEKTILVPTRSKE